MDAPRGRLGPNSARNVSAKNDADAERLTARHSSAEKTKPHAAAWGFLLGPSTEGVGERCPVHLRSARLPPGTMRAFTRLDSSRTCSRRMNLGFADALRRRLGPAMPSRPT